MNLLQRHQSLLETAVLPMYPMAEPDQGRLTAVAMARSEPGRGRSAAAGPPGLAGVLDLRCCGRTAAVHLSVVGLRARNVVAA